MVYEATESLQDLAPTIVVGLICLWRVVRYIHRRHDARYANWQPAEIVVVRSLAMIITGKPLETGQWRRINLVVLLLIAAIIGVEIYDARHVVPLRRVIWERITTGR